MAPLIDDAATMSSDVAHAHDVMTVPASLAGVPAISVPAGLDDTTGVLHNYRMTMHSWH